MFFSRTLKNIEWKTAKLAKRDLKEEGLELRQSPNGGSKNILVGSPSLIITLLNLNFIDEFQLCVHPIIAGKGLPLFEKINNRIDLKYLKTKTFNCGAVIHYYEPAKK